MPTQARLTEPHLARYENDWATDEMLRRYYSPRRRLLNSQKREAADGVPDPSTPPQISREKISGYTDDGVNRTVRKAVFGPISSWDPTQKTLYGKYVVRCRLSFDIYSLVTYCAHQAAVRVAAATAGVTFDAPLLKIPHAQIAQTISMVSFGQVYSP